MATLILNGRAVSARLEGEHVAITRHDIAGSPTERLPLPVIARVLVVGRPAIAFPVLAAFMERGIPCCFVDGTGRFRGALDCPRRLFTAVAGGSTCVRRTRASAWGLPDGLFPRKSAMPAVFSADWRPTAP